jgi:hypothetical protein
MPALLEREEVQITDNGDFNLVAHYIKKTDFDGVWLNGDEVEALCGKRWTPNRDVKGLPICGACKDIFDGMPAFRPDGDE